MLCSWDLGTKTGARDGVKERTGDSSVPAPELRDIPTEGGVTVLDILPTAPKTMGNSKAAWGGLHNQTVDPA